VVILKWNQIPANIPMMLLFLIIGESVLCNVICILSVWVICGVVHLLQFIDVVNTSCDFVWCGIDCI